MSDAAPNLAWIEMLPVDPVPWLLDCDEPAARWIALVELLGRPAEDPEVVAAHEAVLADRETADLLDRLAPWDVEVPLSGHDKPHYGPNRLSLLADMGVTAADDERIADVLSCMLEHQSDEGRFLALGRWRGQAETVWAALPCDSHAIAETLVRAGYERDPRVVRALARIVDDLMETTQGSAWGCLPDPQVAFRGPGRKDDCCPQATIEALRAFSYLPAEERPEQVAATGRVVLRVWRDRGVAKPYMFGHGRQFKRGKWPPTWYSALEVVDTVGRYPELWAPLEGDPEDRLAIAEIAACLVAYTFDDEARVTPRSAFSGYEQHSFGQKKAPSAFATARTCVALSRLAAIASEVAAVDVLALGSSKGGTGTPVPP